MGGSLRNIAGKRTGRPMLDNRGSERRLQVFVDAIDRGGKRNDKGGMEVQRERLGGCIDFLVQRSGRLTIVDKVMSELFGGGIRAYAFTDHIQRPAGRMHLMAATRTVEWTPDNVAKVPSKLFGGGIRAYAFTSYIGRGVTFAVSINHKLDSSPPGDPMTITLAMVQQGVDIDSGRERGKSAPCRLRSGQEQLKNRRIKTVLEKKMRSWLLSIGYHQGAGPVHFTFNLLQTKLIVNISSSNEFDCNGMWTTLGYEFQCREHAWSFIYVSLTIAQLFVTHLACAINQDTRKSADSVKSRHRNKSIDEGTLVVALAGSKFNIPFQRGQTGAPNEA
ncbi:hypothetical protein BU17DRAFT_67655 [Hysterangium stoloniferum]|nr:hypothetical protein BU17DRAFT_67655 [Hysterangium stoloniferum]